MTYEMVCVVCAAVVIIVFICAVAYVLGLYMDGYNDYSVRNELSRLHRQCDGMCLMYDEIQKRLDGMEKR